MFLVVALIPCIDIDQCSGLRVDLAVFRFSDICVYLANSLFLPELGAGLRVGRIRCLKSLGQFGPFLAVLFNVGHRIL